MKFSTLYYISLFALFHIFCQAKSNYQKNTHVKYDVSKEDDEYVIDYTFMGHIGSTINIKLNYDIEKTNIDIEKFGVPKNMLEPYEVTSKVIEEREKMLADGMFKVKHNNIFVDLNAAVNYYAPKYCKPIADFLIAHLRENNLDNRHHRIELAMKFTQDIPYAIPDNLKKRKYTGGALCPPEVLIEGYGDCDSKTMLFASILIFMIDAEDIIFVGQTNHMLTAIKNEKIPGGTYYELEGDKYFIAETAGPGRQAFGEEGKHYTKTRNIERLELLIPVNIPETLNNDVKMALDNKYYSIQIENLCKEQIKYIIRYKNIQGNWVFSDWNELGRNNISEIYSTQEKYFYLHAYNNQMIWGGSNIFQVNGENYNFVQVPVQIDQSGTYVMRIRCK